MLHTTAPGHAASSRVAGQLPAAIPTGTPVITRLRACVGAVSEQVALVGHALQSLHCCIVHADRPVLGRLVRVCLRFNK